MKRLLTLFVFLFLFSGCGAPAPAEESPRPASDVTPTYSPEYDPQQPTAGDFQLYLNVSSTGQNEASFAWQVAEDMERPEKFRLIRSEDADPVFDGKNYWYQVHGTRDAATWTEFPTGTFHVRLCSFDKEAGACDIYSNDVTVSVQ